MTRIAPLLFVMAGTGGALFTLGRRHGRRAQLPPLPELLMMIGIACTPIVVLEPLALLWLLPLVSYVGGQWAGLRPSAVVVRQARVQRKHLLRELRAGNIRFHFQPVMDQFEGVVVACEALARWHKPGAVEGPGPWLDMIEADAELAGLFDDQLLVDACQFAAQWPHVRISLNTMPERMAEPGWAERALGRIVAHGGVPQQYTYEVLEGTFLSAEPTVYENLELLRTAGCHVALDDFGEGQANVMRFMSFCDYVDTIKIDQKLIQHPDRRGASCLIRLAQDYSMTVVAEGVETPDQLTWLGGLGVSQVQGWVYSKALPPNEAGRFIVESGPGSAAPTCSNRARRDARSAI